jgi:hypothetical protein
MHKISFYLVLIGLLSSFTSSARPERPYLKSHDKNSLKNQILEEQTLAQKLAPFEEIKDTRQQHYIFFACYKKQGRIDGADYQKVRHLQDSALVTAIAHPGYRFTQWDDGSTENPRKLYKVDGNRFFFAQFKAESKL